MRNAVLIASANPVAMQEMEERLRGHDFEVKTANSAEAAMSQMSGGKDPVVTLIDEEIDCQPGSFRVTSWFKKNGGRTAVIIVGDDQPNSAVEALDAGADDFVTQATDFREVICRIRALLRRFPAE